MSRSASWVSVAGPPVALDVVNKIADRRTQNGAPQPPIRFLGLFDPRHSDTGGGNGNTKLSFIAFALDGPEGDRLWRDDCNPSRWRPSKPRLTKPRSSRKREASPLSLEP